MRSILLIFLLITIGCKTKQLKDAPSIDHIYEYVNDVQKDDGLMDSGKQLGGDRIGGKIVSDDGKIITLAALKFVVNDSICVNAYSDFDGQFGLWYDKNLIGDKSHFVVMFKKFSKKIVPFYEFQKNNSIVLHKNDKIITEKEYLKFYEEIRSCTR